MHVIFRICHSLSVHQAVAPRKRNTAVASSFRTIVENSRSSGNSAMLQDVQNAILFLRSQREHKVGQCSIIGSLSNDHVLPAPT